MAETDSDNSTNKSENREQKAPEADRSASLESRAKELADKLRKGPLSSSTEHNPDNDTNPDTDSTRTDTASKAKELKKKVVSGSEEDKTVASVKQSLSSDEGPPSSKHESADTEKQKLSKSGETNDSDPKDVSEQSMKKEKKERGEKDPVPEETGTPITREAVKEAAVGTRSSPPTDKGGEETIQEEPVSGNEKPQTSSDKQTTPESRNKIEDRDTQSPNKPDTQEPPTTSPSPSSNATENDQSTPKESEKATEKKNTSSSGDDAKSSSGSEEGDTKTPPSEVGKHDQEDEQEKAKQPEPPDDTTDRESESDETVSDAENDDASSSTTVENEETTEKALDPDSDPHSIPSGAKPEKPEGKTKVDVEEGTVPDDVSEEDLAEVHREIQQIEEVVNNLSDWVQNIQDREVVEELKEMGLEERLSIIEETLGYVDSNNQKGRLRKLQRIFEEWEEAKIPDKVDYLYKQYQQLDKDVEKTKQFERKFADINERIDELSSAIDTQDIPDDLEKQLKDHEEKLFTLRDRIKEVQENAASGGLSEDDQDELVETVREEIQEDVAELVDEAIEQRGGTDGASDSIEELKERIKELENESKSGIDVSNVDETTRNELIHEVAQQIPETKIDELESRIGRLEMNMPSDMDDVGSPEEIGELKAKINQALKLKERISELEEGQSEIFERLGDTEALQETVTELDNTQEELQDKLDEWIETVEHREDQFDSKLAQLDQELTTEVESLRQEFLDTMGEKHADIQDRLDQLEQSFDTMKEDFIEDQVDMQERVDDIDEEFRNVVSEFRQLEDQVYEMSDAVRYALQQVAEAKKDD